MVAVKGWGTCHVDVSEGAMHVGCHVDVSEGAMHVRCHVDVSDGDMHVQGYLTYKKTQPPWTLP